MPLKTQKLDFIGARASQFGTVKAPRSDTPTRFSSLNLAGVMFQRKCSDGFDAPEIDGVRQGLCQKEDSGRSAQAMLPARP